MAMVVREMGQPPSTDPHTIISGLIEDNMVSPDGTWTPTVNDGWLEAKKQKTFQISVVSGYGDIMTAHMVGGTGDEPRIVSQFMMVTLFHPTRTGLWDLYCKFSDVMNNSSLVSGSVNSNSDYLWIKIARSDETKGMNMIDKICGPDKKSESCLGFRMDLTLEIRWNE